MPSTELNKHLCKPQPSARPLWKWTCRKGNHFPVLIILTGYHEDMALYNDGEAISPFPFTPSYIIAISQNRRRQVNIYLPRLKLGRYKKGVPSTVPLQQTPCVQTAGQTAPPAGSSPSACEAMFSSLWSAWRQLMVCTTRKTSTLLTATAPLATRCSEHSRSANRDSSRWTALHMRWQHFHIRSCNTAANVFFTSFRVIQAVNMVSNDQWCDCFIHSFQQYICGVSTIC